MKEMKKRTNIKMEIKEKKVVMIKKK